MEENKTFEMDTKSVNLTLDGAGKIENGEKLKEAVHLGRLGGLKRAQNLSKERLTEIGRLGANARWGDKPNAELA